MNTNPFQPISCSVSHYNRYDRHGDLQQTVEVHVVTCANGTVWRNEDGGEWAPIELFTPAVQWAADQIEQPTQP